MNNKKVLLIIITASVLILALAAFFIKARNNSTTSEDVKTSGSTSATPTNGSSQASTTSAPSANQSDVRMIAIEAGNFFFNPNEIRVKKGEKVKVTLTNNGGVMHDFTIDEFSVKTPRVNSGQTGSVEFVVDKVGTFEFYCSVGTHRQLGQTGKLIVE